MPEYALDANTRALAQAMGAAVGQTDAKAEGGKAAAVPHASYADATVAPKLATQTRISAIVGTRLLEWVRDPTGTCLGGGWSPADLIVNPLFWGAVGDGVVDDAPAIQAMASWVNAKVSVQRPTFLFPAGYVWRLGSTVDFNFRGGMTGNILMQSPIRPDPGIGDGFRIFNGRGGELHLWVDGGGQGADYSQADPVGCDQAFMLRGLRGATLSVRGYNYKGRVLRITKNLSSEFKTSKFNIHYIYTGDLQGAVTAVCGQAWYIDTDTTAFGYIHRAWPNREPYGPVFEDTIDISWGAMEGGWNGASGVELRGCASVWGSQTKLGDESNTLPALLTFKDSATRRCWNIRLGIVFVIGAVNGVTMENVGFDLSGVERPGMVIDLLTSHDNAGAGLKIVNSANLKIYHDSYKDVNALDASGALTNSDIQVNYRRNRQASMLIGAGCGKGLRLSGSVKDANTSGAADISAINIQSIENIDANDFIVSGSAVVDLIRLPSGNQFRMRGGSLSTGGSTVRFGGSQPKLADHVRGYVTSKRGAATILAGQASVVVEHGLDITPEYIFLQTRNSDANGSRVRPSTIGATTFAIQTISGTVAADSTVYWEAKAGNAP